MMMPKYRSLFFNPDYYGNFYMWCPSRTKNLLKSDNTIEIDHLLPAKLNIMQTDVNGEPLNAHTELEVAVVQNEPGVERPLELG